MEEETKKSSPELIEQMAQEEFEKIIRPVMKWLAENRNPHTKIVVESNLAELFEGKMTLVTDEYLVD